MELLHMAHILRKIAAEAATAIMDVYGQPDSDFGVQYKDDASPLTKADEASHRIIAAGLAQHFPDIPVMSEEGTDTPYPERANWEHFFCVDPLDGTKEFINRNGEFCVNIAFVKHRSPALGIIHVPVHDAIYWGGKTIGSFKNDSPIRTKAPQDAGVMVQSRSHQSPELASWANQNGHPRIDTVGAARKFCIIAEGNAHFYPRFNPTMEWDTAAGHAILEGAGGSMTNHDGSPFLYNKENLKNGGFIASWSPTKE